MFEINKKLGVRKASLVIGSVLSLPSSRWPSYLCEQEAAGHY